MGISHQARGNTKPCPFNQMHKRESLPHPRSSSVQLPPRFLPYLTVGAAGVRSPVPFLPPAGVVLSAVAVDRFYDLPCDPFEHRRNEGQGSCFPSPWRRDTKSPTVAIVSAAAVAAAPVITLATLAAAVAPSAAVPAVAFHPAVAADADIAGTAPAHPPCRIRSSPQQRSSRCSTFAYPQPQPSIFARGGGDGGGGFGVGGALCSATSTCCSVSSAG